jgi:malate dehydrogenase (quinone)
LVVNPLFSGLEFIAGHDEVAHRLPLLAAKHHVSQHIALDWAPGGTDVDFGTLTRQLIGHAARGGMTTLFGHEVRDLHRESDGSWTLSILNRRTGVRRRVNARFVFVGAGGGAVPLLQKSGIREAKGLGGFPVAGAFLRTDSAALTAAHPAKVYTMPAPDAPPLAGDHLDIRFIHGKPWLVFGPFAGWSPKFLKHGKMTDLPFSIRAGNVSSMVKVGLTHSGFIRYLIGQLALSESDRLRALHEFAPGAAGADWELRVAGQRVNVIQRGEHGGVLEFGTTVVSSADGSIAGLLGASPGASTAVPVMLDVMERCFPDRYRSWIPGLTEMVPSLGVELSEEPALFDEVWAWTTKVLKLDQPATVGAA